MLRNLALIVALLACGVGCGCPAFSGDGRILCKVTSADGAASQLKWRIPATNTGKFASARGNSDRYVGDYVGLDAATVVGDSIEYTIAGVPAGSYKVLVNLFQTKEAGIFSVSCGNTVLGEYKNRAPGGKPAYTSMNRSLLTVASSGDVTIRFTCTEAPLPGGKFALAVASILLKPSTTDFAHAETNTTPAQEGDVSSPVAALKRKYGLTWHDEFDGNTLNGNNWSFVGSSCHINGEKQLYCDTMDEGNCAVSGGLFNILCKKEPRDDPFGKAYEYTSGAVCTNGLKQSRFGVVECRAKLPKGQGAWPAFWLLGYDPATFGCTWPKTGEIDIIELWGDNGSGNGNRNVTSALHYGGNENVGAYTLPASTDFSQDFHLFGMIWTDKMLYFYLDNYIYCARDISNPKYDAFRNHDFYIILNFALDPHKYPFPEGLCPQTMSVDYVRVYQSKQPVGSEAFEKEFRSFDAKSITASGNTELYMYSSLPKSDQVGQEYQYTLPAVKAGTYSVYVQSSDSAKMGSYQASVDGKAIGDEVKFVAATKTNTSHKLGRIVVKQDSDVLLKLTGTGKGKYEIDRFILIEAGEGDR